MKKLFYGLLILLMAGCKEKYKPDFTAPETGYLVVEGLINKGPDSTVIELSRTNKINSIVKQYEKGALVQLEGDDNSSFKLVEISVGKYTAKLNLNDSKQYRLRIKTSAGKEYLSDFVEVKITPPIDSISWQRENNNGLQLYINTHDPQNKTLYYQWEYKETWEFHSSYYSILKFNLRPAPGGPIPYLAYKDSTTFGADTTIFKCWRSAVNTNFIIGSSVKLTEDRIYKPFHFIPRADKRGSVLYSISLKQHALTKNGYEFLEKMKRNTEENGSIFDPQPSELKGNIHAVADANEPVIGYINISSLEEKRIFISNGQLTDWNYRANCEEIKVRNNKDSIADVYGAGWVPTGVMEIAGTFITYFGAARLDCIDCTLSGSNVRPTFWR